VSKLRIVKLVVVILLILVLVIKIHREQHVRLRVELGVILLHVISNNVQKTADTGAHKFIEKYLGAIFQATLNWKKAFKAIKQKLPAGSFCFMVSVVYLV